MVRLISTVAITATLLLGVSSRPVTDGSTTNSPATPDPNKSNSNLEDQAQSRIDLVQGDIATEKKYIDIMKANIVTMDNNVKNYENLLNELQSDLEEYENTSQ